MEERSLPFKDTSTTVDAHCAKKKKLREWLFSTNGRAIYRVIFK